MVFNFTENHGPDSVYEGGAYFTSTFLPPII